MSKKIYLSIIIPCYNEKENLETGVLDEVEEYLVRQDYVSEVIISDDGSTDNSLDFVKKYLLNHPRFHLLKNPHAGKPFAIRSGVEKAKGEIVLFADMDQSAPISEVEKLLPFFKKGFDVVIGSRGQKRKGFSFFRVFASNAFRVIRQVFLLRGITDTQCGFKAFKTKTARDLFSRVLLFKEAKKTKGWRVSAFDVELLFLAQKQNCKIAEVMVDWRDRDVVGKKGIQFFKESQEMLKEILRVKLNDLSGRYQ